MTLHRLSDTRLNHIILIGTGMMGEHSCLRLIPIPRLKTNHCPNAEKEEDPDIYDPDSFATCASLPTTLLVAVRLLNQTMIQENEILTLVQDLAGARMFCEHAAVWPIPPGTWSP